MREWDKQYHKEKYHNDVQYKLTNRLRGRLYTAIRMITNLVVLLMIWVVR